MIPTQGARQDLKSKASLGYMSPKPKQNDPPIPSKPIVLWEKKKKKPDTEGLRVCDPTDRKRPEQANPETAIGLVVARAAGGPRKGSKQAE